MKSEEQIKDKIEQLKMDLNGKFASNYEENLRYSIVLKTLTWVLENKKEGDLAMNKDKIEIFWNLIPKELNQWSNDNEFNCRIKSNDFDFVIGGITLDKNEIDNRNALNIIANELTKSLQERKKPIYLDWFYNK